VDSNKDKYNKYVEQRKQLMARKAVIDAEYDALNEQIADIDIDMGLLLKEIERAKS
jgi:hypothetical protein